MGQPRDEAKKFAHTSLCLEVIDHPHDKWQQKFCSSGEVKCRARQVKLDAER